MLIRHDLKLIFIHVPKCAGKEIRDALKIGASSLDYEELWNYDYDYRLHRYVDLAHLPASDLVHYKQFNHFSDYHVIACVRSPYERLYSASNEYYRQFSAHTEQLVANDSINSQMRHAYYQQLDIRHALVDPLFIHSLPIVYFTHLGFQPLVDTILRCESLRSDFLSMASRLALPAALVDAASERLVNLPIKPPNTLLDDESISLANTLYHLDFSTYGYQQVLPTQSTTRSLTLSENSLHVIHQKQRLKMHWGPSATRNYPQSLVSCR